MFLRPFRSRDSPSRIEKPRLLRPKPSRLRSVTDAQGRTSTTTGRTATTNASDLVEPVKSSPVVTITVGPEKRLFAAHEHILCKSPYFSAILRGLPTSPNSTIGPHTSNKRISLPDETPEVFSAILEFLYTEEYYPRLQRSSTGDWELEDSSPPSTIPNPYGHVTLPTPPNSPPQKHTRPPGHLQSVCPTITLPNQPPLLRETVLYCAATTYLLPSLSRLCLRKQGLQSGIDVATILRSAQYAYANTPDSDSRLRAHYLALIIRCRGTFKRSGTLQREMERGGSKLFFDLFVALCNHVDDVIEATGAGETEARMI